MHIGSTLQKQPIGKFHNVGFVQHGDFFALPPIGETKSPGRDTLTRLLGCDLHTHYNARSDLVFNTAIETLGVLADNDQIDTFVAGFHARHAAYRANGGV